MTQETTEGIVLRAIDYKDSQKIITVFSRDAGVISLILKGLSSKKTSRLALTSPFCEAEFLYRRGKSDLFSFIDGTPVNENLHFRTQLSTLQAAGKLTGAILRSQLQGKPAPLLYQLLRTYFAQLPRFSDPAPLIASFYLKLLKHEGLLALSEVCAECGVEPARCLRGGESLCPDHHSGAGFSFMHNEWEALLQLEGAHHFPQLRGLALPPILFDKIAALFGEYLNP